MLLKTHRAVTIAAATYYLMETQQPAINYSYLIAVAIGTALPDIDSSSSLLGRIFSPISRMLRHRGITHSLYAVIAMALWAYFSGSRFVIALAFGYIMHIVEDGFSSAGIDWLMTGYALQLPFSYTVGSRFETWLRWSSCLATIIFILWAFGV